MKYRLLTYVVPIFITLLAQEAWTASVPTISCAKVEIGSPLKSGEALKLYDQVTATVTAKFYDQTFRHLPWPQLIRNYRSCLTANSGLDQLKETTNGLLKNLKASHTEFVTNTDQEYYGLASIFSHSLSGARIYQIGAWFERVDDRWFVISVFEGSIAEKAGLQRGDEILSANSSPFAPVKSLNKKGFVELRFRRTAGGSVSALKIRPRYESVQESLYRATRLSKKIMNVNRKRIAYFHLWSGTHDLFLDEIRKVARAMETQSDGFILDLRDGFGGAYGDYIAPFLALDPETRKPIPQVYTKPMVVLINEGVRSGKEGIANSLKVLKRATLVGTTTAGHYLAGQYIEVIPKRAALYLAVNKASDAPEIEGSGVSPDLEVVDPLPYSEGRDLQLDAAVSLFK